MHPKYPRRSRGLRPLPDLLIEDVEGATAIEYGLIAALIAVALIGAIDNLREALFGLPLGTISEVIASVLS